MTKKQIAPHGYNSVTPYLTAINADELISFISAVFDAPVIFENRHPDGTVQHVRMEVGDSLLMINQSSDDYPENESQLHVYVANVEQTFQRALDNHATSLMKPNIRPHGDIMAGFRDPCGNRWWVASPGT